MKKHLYEITYTFKYKDVECNDSHRERFHSEVEAMLAATRKVYVHSTIEDSFVLLSVKKIS